MRTSSKGDVKTAKVVAIMLALSFVISAIMAYFQLSAFFLAIFLVPAITAAYYQRTQGHIFEKSQRKSISLWYVGISTLLGLIPLVVLISESKDRIKEPLVVVLLALVFGVLTLAVIAYFLVYWVLGMDYGAK